MPGYREMYFQLAAKLADAIALLEEAQRQGEARYIEEKPQRDSTDAAECGENGI